MTRDAHSQLYCWFDTEYTDLDLSHARILEVALIVTTTDLVPVPLETRHESIPEKWLRVDGYGAPIQPPPMDQISEHVRTNYTPLLERCAAHGLSEKLVDEHLAACLDSVTPPGRMERNRRPILAGNTVHADLLLAQKYLPRFSERLNYRILDVTAFKLEWHYHFHGEKFRKEGEGSDIARYYPGREPISGAKHDAYYDVQASIAELAFYRSNLSRSQLNSE